MLITLDFDEVLFPLMDPFLKWMKATHCASLKLTAEQVVNYDLKPWFKRNTLEYIEEFFFSTEMQQIPPEPGAVAAVQNLLASGFELAIVTGRPEFAKARTEVQLARYFPRLKIWCTSQYYENSKDKMSECFRLRSAMHVDDSVETVNKCHRAGIRSIFVRRPWKYTTPVDPNIAQADSWQDILPLIKRGK